MRLLERLANLCMGRQRISEGEGRGLRFDPGSSNPAYLSGSNEIPVQQAIRDHLRAGDTFYDIGANVGFFSVIGSRLVGERGRVYAFEPVATNAKLIARNCALNRIANVAIFQKAIGERTGKAELILARCAGGATLASVARPPDATQSVEVDLISLDDALDSHHLYPPTLVKIDVEGAELDCLRGMRNALRLYQPVLVYEIDDRTPEGLKDKQRACERFLVDAGYEVRELPTSYQGIDWEVRHFIATAAGAIPHP